MGVTESKQTETFKLPRYKLKKNIKKNLFDVMLFERLAHVNSNSDPGEMVPGLNHRSLASFPARPSMVLKYSDFHSDKQHQS